MDVKISENFKKHTSKAILSIVSFIVVYILLLLFAVGLTVACVSVGIALIVIKPMFLTIALGFGLASLGFLVLIFLFKFIFKKHQIDRSHFVEITKAQEPKLFELIEKIVQEVETDFPKKIYLSSEVNASVFYDSSFWSMFFPIKKNLHIGLGLVNTVTEEEFKAILAHEFGHFSQKSMKVGSYVYNVNQVIFNMLYDNESYGKLIQGLLNISDFFSVFVALAVKIIKAIQWVLQKMYEVINLNYMALSREMEFHADEVAANVAGYLPLKESLLRLDLAGHSYNVVLNFYGSKIAENIKSKNIFDEQKMVMQFLAKQNELTFKNDLPLVSEMDLKRYNKSKLNVKDQWASHPTTEERVQALEKLNIVKENPTNSPAILLFKNPEQITKQLTEQLFSKISYKGLTYAYNVEEFKKDYLEDYNKNSFGKIYNSYYDSNNINSFDVEKLENKENTHTLEELFSKEKVDMVYEFIALENDKNAILGIVNKEYNIKTFDYDGQKYLAAEGKKLIPEMEKEMAVLKDKITDNDIDIYVYFYKIAKEKGLDTVLKEKYLHFLEMDKNFESKFELYTKMLEGTSFISEQTSFETIKAKFSKLKILEASLKKEIRELLSSDLCKADIDPELKKYLDSYIAYEREYFKNQNYDDDALDVLHHAVSGYSYLLSRMYFLTKKDLLVFQSGLVG